MSVFIHLLVSAAFTVLSMLVQAQSPVDLPGQWPGVGHVPDRVVEIAVDFTRDLAGRTWGCLSR